MFHKGEGCGPASLHTAAAVLSHRKHGRRLSWSNLIQEIRVFDPIPEGEVVPQDVVPDDPLEDGASTDECVVAFRDRLAPQWAVPQLVAQHHPVLLENVTTAGAHVRLFARVRNMAFEKVVFARITFDGWRSYRDIPGRHVNSLDDGASDRFLVEFTVPRKAHASVHFAVCAEMNGERHWDNAEGSNYHFLVRA